MSAGGIIGYFFNLLMFAGLWTVVGVVVDKLGMIFNITIQLMPTYQDAVNGFSMMQTIYGFVLPVIVFIFLTINYFAQENSMSSGEV
jgi:hypothetical protein